MSDAISRRSFLKLIRICIRRRETGQYKTDSKIYDRTDFERIRNPPKKRVHFQNRLSEWKSNQTNNNAVKTK